MSLRVPGKRKELKKDFNRDAVAESFLILAFGLGTRYYIAP
jgi:hypothetical protein